MILGLSIVTKSDKIPGINKGKLMLHEKLQLLIQLARTVECPRE